MKRLSRKPRAVLFDMDGVIFDTEVLYRDAVLKAAKDNGFSLPVSIYLETIGLPGPDARDLLQNYLGEEISIDGLWSRASAHFHTMVKTELRLKTGLLEMLTRLEDLQIPCAIATSSDRDTVQSHLFATGLHERFEIIIAHGDYAAGKPDPEPYLKAAERLGVPPEACVALEDSHNGILAASRAGLMAIMVPDLVQPTPDIACLCECVANDLHAAWAIIANSVEENSVG